MTCRQLLIVVSAPSGAGKTTLCDRLLEEHSGIVYSVSCTTRAPRGQEQDGRNYYFLTEEEFDERLAAGLFLEHAVVHGHRYGTLRSTVEQTFAEGKSVLMDIDVQGAAQIREAVDSYAEGDPLKAGFVDVFIEPPSMEVLKSRLFERAEDHQDEIQRRLAVAENEMSCRDDYTYRVVNDDIDRAYRELEKCILGEISNCKSYSVSDHLSAWAKSTLTGLFPDQAERLTEVTVVPTGNPEFGDYQCNECMRLGKLLKRPPREIAQIVADKAQLPECVAKVDIAGPGFVNIFLADEWLAGYANSLTDDLRLGVPETGGGRTVVMDYGSPNMSKPLHIGHLRSPNIGSTLDRIFRFLGFHVLSDNHLGDWGTQFGITIMGYRHFGDPEAMNKAPMEELERVYVLSYERGKEDPGWIDQCRSELVKLQSGDEENMALWKQFMELSLQELNKIYGRLGVSFDLVRGESYYRDQLPGVVAELKDKNIIRESEGAQVAFFDDDKLPPAIVQKSDGGFNYAATDIATVLDRVNEFNPDSIVYLTDERQQLHFNQFFAVCRKLGVEVDMKHVWFGLMRLPEGAFSTRDGNVIRLEALLDDAERRATEIVKNSSTEMTEEEQREVGRAVGIGAVKYADLSQNPETMITFTWDRAMALDGNSGPYLQYAYARIASVHDKYVERFPDTKLEEFPIKITEPIERTLIVKLMRFQEAVIRAGDSYRPSVLCDYLYDLAQTYSTFYQNVPFLKAPEVIRESRVNLCGVVAAVLKKGLDLLGIDTPPRI